VVAKGGWGGGGGGHEICHFGEADYVEREGVKDSKTEIGVATRRYAE
jgi:hypothetical protein